MTVSFILAGAVWPAVRERDALAARIVDACPAADVSEAREGRDVPRGAAAVIGDPSNCWRPATFGAMSRYCTTAFCGS